MTAPRLRAASPADGEAVARLLAAASLPPPGDAPLGPNFVVGQDEAGRIFAAAGVEVWGDWGLLRSVVVDPEHRSSGAGMTLVLDRIDWSRRQGLRALYLLTTTAKEYFPRFGFEVVPRESAPAEIASSPEWRSVCPASATAMRLGL